MNAPPGPAISLGQYSVAGRKDHNDDSYGVLVPTMPLLASKGIAMAIADGMSSSAGAKEASECCVKSFLEDYYCTHASWTVPKSVGTVLKATNSWLHAQGLARHDNAHGMVSTFSGLVLKAGTAHLFHVGDSRIGRLRAARIEPLTREHRSPGRRGQAYLARAFGADANLEIDYRAEPVQPGDLFVFTTDGVHDHVTPARMAALIAAAPDLDAAARAIVGLAHANGSDDNLTCQLVRIDATGAFDSAGHLRAIAELPFPPELEPGMDFEGYRILRTLHLSNRTQIYLAEETTGGSPVVIKTPSRNFEDDPLYLERFGREERIGRLLGGPHVLRVLPTAHPRRYLYYVTEFCDGTTLRQWMRDHPHPDLATVRAVVAQIAKGLHAFHRKQVLHQDLKPDNIMIDRHGTVKIIDFGSAQAAGFAEGEAGAAETALRGTVAYTAPECLLGATPDSRVDIYALGAIAYEMLTGRLPYGQGFANRRDVARRDYVPARHVREDIPAWVDAALAKAVAKRPEERTEALSALVVDLERPGEDFDLARIRPWIERDPVALWRAVALLLLASNLLSLAWFVR